MCAPIRHKVHQNFRGQLRTSFTIFQVQRAYGSLQISSAGLLNASTEMEIILSIEFSLPYVTRKCKLNSQLFCSFRRYFHANMLRSLELIKLWNVSGFYWASCTLHTRQNRFMYWERHFCLMFASYTKSLPMKVLFRDIYSISKYFQFLHFLLKLYIDIRNLILPMDWAMSKYNHTKISKGFTKNKFNREWTVYD